MPPPRRGAAGQYPRLQLPRGDGGHERAGGCHPRETTTFGEAYHWGDNYLTAGNVHDRHPAPESGAFYARLRHERYLNGQTRMQATTSCPTLCPGQVLKVTGGEEVAGVC